METTKIKNYIWKIKNQLLIIIILLFNYMIVEQYINIENNISIFINIILIFGFSFILQYDNIKEKVDILSDFNGFQLKVKKYFILIILKDYFSGIFLLSSWCIIPYILLGDNPNNVYLIGIYFIFFCIFSIIVKLKKNIYESYKKNYMFYEFLCNFIKNNKDTIPHNIKLYLEDKINDDYYKDKWKITKETDNNITFENVYNKSIVFKIKFQLEEDKEKEYISYTIKLLVNDMLIRDTKYYSNI